MSTLQASDIFNDAPVLGTSAQVSSTAIVLCLRGGRPCCHSLSNVRTLLGLQTRLLKRGDAGSRTNAMHDSYPAPLPVQASHPPALPAHMHPSPQLASAAPAVIPTMDTLDDEEKAIIVRVRAKKAALAVAKSALESATAAVAATRQSLLQAQEEAARAQSAVAAVEAMAVLHPYIAVVTLASNVDGCKLVVTFSPTHTRTLRIQDVTT